MESCTLSLVFGPKGGSSSKARLRPSFILRMDDVDTSRTLEAGAHGTSWPKGLVILLLLL